MVEDKKNSHFEFVDEIKGFAIFLVILGHGIIDYPINLLEIKWCAMLETWIYSFHMPLFFVISGFCYKYGGNYVRYIEKKIRRLIIPYWVYGMSWAVLQYVFSHFVHNPISISEGIKAVIFYGAGGWFIFVLFVILALGPMACAVYDKNRVGASLCCWLLVVWQYGDISQGFAFFN